MKRVISKKAHNAPRLCVRISDWLHKPIDAIPDEIGNAAGQSSYGRYAARHCFERRKPEGFHLAGEMQYVHTWEEAIDVVLLAQEADVRIDL